jgi:hypothetical protein
MVIIEEIIQLDVPRGLGPAVSGHDNDQGRSCGLGLVAVSQAKKTRFEGDGGEEVGACR